MRQREFRVALDGAGQMCGGALERVLPIGGALAQACHKFVYASGSLLYRSRDFGTADGNRLCSDSGTRVQFRPGPRTRCPN